MTEIILFLLSRERNDQGQIQYKSGKTTKVHTGIPLGFLFGLLITVTASAVMLSCTKGFDREGEPCERQKGRHS